MARAVLLLGSGAALVALGSRLLPRSDQSAADTLPRRIVRTAATVPGAPAVALVAAALGGTSLAAGAAYGGPVFAFALMGAALLVEGRPLPAPGRTSMLVAAAALVAGALPVADQVIERAEAVLLLTAYVLLLSPRGSTGADGTGRGRTVTRSLLGLGALLGGAVLLAVGGSGFAEAAVLAPGFVGAALVGALAWLGRPGRRGGRASGGGDGRGTDRIFDVIPFLAVAVPGAAAVVRPLEVDSGATSALIALAVMYAVTATPLLARGRAGRAVGASLILTYGGWLVLASRI